MDDFIRKIMEQMKKGEGPTIDILFIDGDMRVSSTDGLNLDDFFSPEKRKYVESTVISEEDKPDNSEPDKKYFKQGVIEHKDAVFAQDDPELHRAYIRACIKVDNMPLAYEALTTLITDPNAKDKELMGLLAHETDNNKAALEHMADIKPTTFEARLVYSLLLHQEKTKYQPEDHIKLLQGDLKNSSIANSFLAMLYFNVKKFTDSRKHFHKALNLGSDSDLDILNLLTAAYASGSELEANTNARELVNKGNTQLSIDEVTDILQRPYIPIPKIKMGEDLYGAAEQLL